MIHVCDNAGDQSFENSSMPAKACVSSHTSLSLSLFLFFLGSLSLNYFDLISGPFGVVTFPAILKA